MTDLDFILGPWPSGKASPLHGEDRRFESDRVHFFLVFVAGEFAKRPLLGYNDFHYAGVVQW